MSHFAKVVENTVIEVIVAEQDFVDALPQEPGVQWIQTSYNTAGGVHLLGGTPLRKNFAAPGYTYDAQRDAFIPPKPYQQWLLDEDSCQWVAPELAPQDGKTYVWNEFKPGWVEWNYYV